jgi:uncharacterized repeat protein (TIGR01451 family)
MKKIFTLLTMFILAFTASYGQCNLDGTFVMYPAGGNSIYVMSNDSTEECNNQYNINYTWSFGDGTSASSQFEFHQYFFAGTFDVCLEVEVLDVLTGDLVETLYSCQTIFIDPCTSLSGQLYMMDYDPNGFYLTANVFGGMMPYTYQYSLNGGAITNGTSSPFFLPNDGSEILNFLCIVIDANGCVYTMTYQEMNPLYQPACDATFTVTNYGFQYYSYSTIQNNFSFVQSWFIDGVQVGQGQSLWYEFEPGIYEITLVVNNPTSGCSETTTQTITVPEPITLCGYAFLDADMDGVFDEGEEGVEGIGIQDFNGVDSVWTDVNGYYEIEVLPGDFNLYANLGNSGYAVVPGGNVNIDGVFMGSATESMTDCNVNFPLEVYQGIFCGTAYIDLNQNNIFDSGEPTLPNVEVSLNIYMGQETTVISTFTDGDGNYCLTSPAGYQYALATYTTLSGTVITVGIYSVVQDDQTVTGVNAPFYFIENAIEVSAYVSSWGQPVPGFTNYNSVTLHNAGELTAVTDVVVYVPVYISVSYVGDLNGVAGVYAPGSNSITWTGVSLAGMSWAYCYYYGYTAIGTPLGTPAITTINADVTNGTDVYLANNSMTISQVVIGSYDPNNKLNSPSGVGETGDMLPSNDAFTYVINFQNTGTSEAVNIRVEDQLDTDLDWSTFQMISASHNYTVEMENGHLVWYFNNIMLPDSNTNEVLSHGQITFRIHPIADKPVGTVFENTAYIYFDFNEAIITNTAVNTFVSSIGVNEVETNAGISIYPNPSEGDFTIAAEDMNAGDYIVIFDAMGREVFRKQVMNSNTTRIDTNLPTGQYVLQIQGSVNVQTTKVVVR